MSKLFDIGSVLLLDRRRFVGNPDVRMTRVSDSDSRPIRAYLCFATDAKESDWIALVGQPKTGVHHVQVDPVDKIGTDPAWSNIQSWTDDPSYIVTIKHSAIHRVIARPVRQSVKPHIVQSVIVHVNDPKQVSRRSLPGGKADPHYRSTLPDPPAKS